MYRPPTVATTVVVYKEGKVTLFFSNKYIFSGIVVERV